MDLTYYFQDFILELYAGQLRGNMELVPEVNPLEWLPLTENFADKEKFAGEQNIAHIVNVALKVPMKEIRENNRAAEVCFARLNGSVVMSKKSTFEGMMEQIRIMSQYLPGISSAYILDMEKKRRCNADDIVDAVCLAITANLSMQGLTEPIPPVPQEDSRGLLMQMIIPKEQCGAL